MPIGAPLDSIALDIVGRLPPTESHNFNIFVVSDYFTKWVEAYALEDKIAYTVADILFNEFISRFGVPRQIHSEQGRNFESQLFEVMQITRNLEKPERRHTAHNLMGWLNGLTELYLRLEMTGISCCPTSPWFNELPHTRAEDVL